MSLYRKIKTFIYVLGICLTIFLILKQGITDSHTPPGGFIISGLMILIGLLIIDIFLKKRLKNFYLHLNTNLISIFINLIIVIVIITAAI